LRTVNVCNEYACSECVIGPLPTNLDPQSVQLRTDEGFVLGWDVRFALHVSQAVTGRPSVPADAIFHHPSLHDILAFELSNMTVVILDCNWGSVLSVTAEGSTRQGAMTKEVLRSWDQWLRCGKSPKLLGRRRSSQNCRKRMPRIR